MLLLIYATACKEECSYPIQYDLAVGIALVQLEKALYIGRCTVILILKMCQHVLSETTHMHHASGHCNSEIRIY